MKEYSKHWLPFILAILIIGGLQAEERPNVLFIAIDDMNDWTGYLSGHPQARMPHLDNEYEYELLVNR